MDCNHTIWGSPCIKIWYNIQQWQTYIIPRQVYNQTWLKDQHYGKNSTSHFNQPLIVLHNNHYNDCKHLSFNGDGTSTKKSVSVKTDQMTFKVLNPLPLLKQLIQTSGFFCFPFINNKVCCKSPKTYVYSRLVSLLVLFICYVTSPNQS